MYRNNLEEALKDIRAFAFDVDGVLTDGGILANLDGELFRTFDSKDGFGLRRRFRAENGFNARLCPGNNYGGPVGKHPQTFHYLRRKAGRRVPRIKGQDRGFSGFLHQVLAPAASGHVFRG